MVWVKVPAMVKLEPKVTDPVEVRFNVKLLIVVLPVVAKVPKAPVPPMERLELLVTFRKFAFGVKLPLSVRVLLETERLPLDSVSTPPIVTSAANVTPLELFI